MGGGHDTENRPWAKASRQGVMGCVSREVSLGGKMGTVKQQNGDKSGRRED